MKQVGKLSLLLGALCASAVAGCVRDTVVDLTAEVAELTLSAESIDFGMADCGGDAPEVQTLTVRNDGNEPVRWGAALDATDYFVITGIRSGLLDPDAEVTITIAAKRMPADVSAGAVQQTALRLKMSDGVQTELMVPIKATARGATFQLVAPSLVDFGIVPVGTEAPAIPVRLKNVGNAPANVSILQPSDSQFSFAWGEEGEVEVDGGDELADLTAHFTPSRPSASSGAAAVAVSGAVCGESVTAIDVKGRGLAGDFGFSPGTVDFGKVECNSPAPAPFTLTLYNSGNQVLSWSAELEKDQHYKLSQSAGAIAANGVSEILITPTAIGMTDNLDDNGYGDTLTITTGLTGEAPVEVAIKQTAHGAVLSLSGGPFDFGEQPVFQASQGEPLSIANDGNAPVEITVDGGPFQATPSSAKIAAGGKLEATVAYKPNNFGKQEKVIGVTAEGPLCQPLPQGILATGEGGKGVAEAITVGGNGSYNSRNIPGEGGCAILKDSGGHVACWGSNEYGQLGVTGPRAIPNVIPGLEKVVKISAGGDYNCAVDSNGSVWCWGNNRNKGGDIVGKLGVPDIPSTDTPVKVVGVSNATDVSCGHNVTCAVIGDGTVTCWGTNNRGNLGNGNSGAFYNAPITVPGLSDVVAVEAGSGGACALKNDKTVHCWGRWNKGTLGNGTTSGVAAPPTQVSLSDVTAITNQSAAAIGGSRCALHGVGSVSCWGPYAHGQLGQGSTTRTGGATTPAAVSGISGATAVAGYYTGACALLNDGTIRCWGRNQYGQVGDGSNAVRSTPNAVSGIVDATAIAAGGRSACAIVSKGAVKCWGIWGIGSSTTPQFLKYFD